LCGSVVRWKNVLPFSELFIILKCELCVKRERKTMKALKIDYRPCYTYDDYVQWEGRWELIDGMPYAMSPLPTIKHQSLSGNIHAQLLELLKECSHCKPLLSVDWKIDKHTVVEPDNLVVCGEVGEEYLTQVPVMVFEILSPSTVFKDRNIKYRIYEAAGVKYYIIVDPNANVAEVFQLEGETYNKLKDAQNDVLHFDLGDCRIDFDFQKIW
jgi:Uma2 family endonuclease